MLIPLLDEKSIIKIYKEKIHEGEAGKNERAYFADGVYRDCCIWILCCDKAGRIFVSGPERGRAGGRRYEAERALHKGEISALRLLDENKDKKMRSLGQLYFLNIETKITAEDNHLELSFRCIFCGR